MKIPIVNEQDEVIGEEERSIIHRDGLMHREIHVWLVTPNKEFIFQKRGPNKDTWPNKLDVTCGGHVDLVTETYKECAERELFEETGQKLEIQFVAKKYSESFDPNTHTKNNAFRATFAAIFTGDIKYLAIEDGHSFGFVKYSIGELVNLSDKEKSEFIPRFFSKDYLDLYQVILDKLFNK